MTDCIYGEALAHYQNLSDKLGDGSYAGDVAKSLQRSRIWDIDADVRDLLVGMIRMSQETDDEAFRGLSCVPGDLVVTFPCMSDGGMRAVQVAREGERTFFQIHSSAEGIFQPALVVLGTAHGQWKSLETEACKSGRLAGTVSDLDLDRAIEETLLLASIVSELLSVKQTEGQKVIEFLSDPEEGRMSVGLAGEGRGMHAAILSAWDGNITHGLSCWEKRA